MRAVDIHPPRPDRAEKIHRLELFYVEPSVQPHGITNRGSTESVVSITAAVGLGAQNREVLSITD